MKTLCTHFTLEMNLCNQIRMINFFIAISVFFFQFVVVYLQESQKEQDIYYQQLY